jgi:ATP dependent DNA ligase-like protein
MRITKDRNLSSADMRRVPRTSIFSFWPTAIREDFFMQEGLVTVLLPGRGKNCRKKHFRSLEISRCPFVNLPEGRYGCWSLDLTAEKMKECGWLKPELVAQFEYVEWAPDKHLRYSRFVALREDVNASKVRRELPVVRVMRADVLVQLRRSPAGSFSGRLMSQAG